MKKQTKKKNFKYDAFISYSRKDIAFAEKLEEALEAYHPPQNLKLPQHTPNIFRDVDDMTGTEYFQAIEEHLSNSKKLILICSPNSCQSKLVNDEVSRFAELRGAEHIIPVLLKGLPNNEAKGEKKDQKAFPQKLCEVMEMPLATSYLGFKVTKDEVNGSEFKKAWFTLLANLYNCSRDKLEQREKRHKYIDLVALKIKIARRGILALPLLLTAILQYTPSDEPQVSKDFLHLHYLALTTSTAQADTNFHEYAADLRQRLEKHIRQSSQPLRFNGGDLDFPRKYFPLLVEICTRTTLNDGKLIPLSDENWMERWRKYTQVITEHNKNCRYKTSKNYSQEYSGASAEMNTEMAEIHY